jgi:hypothetical protein
MDGGYLVPAIALQTSHVLITFGVGPDWSFERDFLKLNSKKRAIAYDFSVSRYLFLEDAFLSLFKNVTRNSNLYQLRVRLMRFFAWNEFLKTPNFEFHQKRVFDRKQFPDCVTVNEVLGDFSNIEDCSLVLKCDIEGGEYRIIDQVLEHSNKISTLIIEFHDVSPLDLVFKSAISKIGVDFCVVHVHPNNSSGLGKLAFPDVVEVTFLHRSLLDDMVINPRTAALHEKDRPCDPKLPEISLIFED